MAPLAAVKAQDGEDGSKGAREIKRTQACLEERYRRRRRRRRKRRKKKTAVVESEVRNPSGSPRHRHPS
ncbi:hypothetical protein EYF80_064725 [Liparis tanakae]|uniref:Uncharacterized protein n=1 Tax=Liparis tanakae TaxID=230148 RepID=A0A4Z2E8L2_9TELE|nr:hypothetical protein EYF80_064725 [Liparis tanakae]